MKIFTWTIKLIIAFALAFIAVNLYAMFFYNYGIRTESDTGVTDYVWKQGAYCQYYEGFGYGHRDATGLNNAWEPQSDNIDIILMGSSQMEANNVPQDKCTSYLLNELAYNNGYDTYTYNIAMEGHAIPRQISHLRDALETYHPSSYIILETMSLDLNVQDLINGWEGNLEPLSFRDTNKLTHYAKLFPAVRILFAQYKSAKGNKASAEPQPIISIESADADNLENDQEEEGYSEDELMQLDTLLADIASTCDEYGCTPAILYIPTAYISGDDYTFRHNEIKRDEITRLCHDNGVILMDMTVSFEQGYQEDFKLPFGFDNTETGYGHMNIYGHGLVSEYIYNQLIKEGDHAVQ